MGNKEGESALVTCLRDEYSNDFRPVDSKITANLVMQDSAGFKSLFGQAGVDHVNGMVARSQELKTQGANTRSQALQPGEVVVLTAA